jgi:hypothetical protein
MSTIDPAVGASSQAAVQNLRPLSIGELLDRAFSICFKNFIAFASLVIVVLLPQIVFTYLGMKNVLSLMGDQIGSLQSVAAGSPAFDPMRIIHAYAQGAPYLAGAVFIVVFFVPLSNAAVVSGVSRAYLGLPIRFADCYADAIARWPSLLGLMLLWIVAGIVATFAFYLFFILLTIALIAMGTMLGTVGGLLAALIGIAAGVGAILVILELYLAAAFSFVAVVLESSGAGGAFSSAFQRVFGEGQVWRSLGISAAIVGVLIGFTIIRSVIGWGTVALFHSFVLDFAVSALFGAFWYPFVFAAVAIAYYDVRIRREGFDLQMLASQLHAAPPPSAPAQ